MFHHIVSRPSESNSFSNVLHEVSACEESSVISFKYVIGHSPCPPCMALHALQPILAVEPVEPREPRGPREPGEPIEPVEPGKPGK